MKTYYSYSLLPEALVGAPFVIEEVEMQVRRALKGKGDVSITWRWMDFDGNKYIPHNKMDLPRIIARNHVMFVLCDAVATPQAFRVAVDVPHDLDQELLNSLFTAVADAVHNWEPINRDGWDADIHTYKTPLEY